MGFVFVFVFGNNLLFFSRFLLTTPKKREFSSVPQRAIGTSASFFLSPPPSPSPVKSRGLRRIVFYFLVM